MNDNHTHLFTLPNDFTSYWDDFDQAGIEKIVMLCVSDPFNPSVNDNARGLLLKKLFPHRVYLFPGCEYSFEYEEKPSPSHKSLEEQVEIYARIGVDGWKFLEGKPAFHKYDLSGPYYRRFLEALARNNLPLLVHVGDPIEFWDASQLPAWAFKEWSYDEDDLDLEYLRRDALKMAAANPDLTIIFPHFFFLGYEPDRAQQLLERYPNVLFDLAPGVEMFFGFSSDVVRSRELFMAFQDRILFGTDRGIADMPARPRAEMIHRFLSTNDEFDPPHSDVVMWPDNRAPITGIGLPDEVVLKITHSNFIDHLGTEPRALDLQALHDEIYRLNEVLPPGDELTNIINRLEQA